MSTFANRGLSFESLIEYANSRYRNKSIAVIEKQHTKFIPIRDRRGKIVSCKVEEKATVDFMGRFGQVPVAFEAKHSSNNRIALDRIQEHQGDFLTDWTIDKVSGSKQGIGFVLVSFKFDDFYLVPWEYWRAAQKAAKTKKPQKVAFSPMKTEWQTTGKASINKDELPDEWRVGLNNSNLLDYLGTVIKLWR